MYKSIETPAINSVVINGTLLGLDMREGKSAPEKGSKPYRSVNTTIRVNQFYNGKNEISEIPVGFFSMKHKKDGTDNPIFETQGKYATEYKTAQRNGIEEATQVNINGRRGNGALSENMFASPQNPETVISTWNVDATFLNEAKNMAPGNAGDCATFDVEIFILNIDREMSSEGEETGRLKIRGGIVKYGRKLDCLDFFVEDKTAIDYIERNYNVNDTAHFVGRLRYTSETVSYETSNTWGEAIPQTSTKKKHELIITGPGVGGEDGPYDEERSYDPEDIRVLVADRNALKEQKKNEARRKATKPAASPAAAKPAFKMEWE